MVKVANFGLGASGSSSCLTTKFSGLDLVLILSTSKGVCEEPGMSPELLGGKGVRRGRVGPSLLGALVWLK